MPRLWRQDNQVERLLVVACCCCTRELQEVDLSEEKERDIFHQTSSIDVASIPLHLQSVAALCNQLLRSGTSIGANNAEAFNAISKADFKSKSFIALKEARESLYWIDLLHRNGYLDDKQYNSLYTDCEELVKLLVHRCKKLNEDKNGEKEAMDD